jgi:hypothetical protein
MWLDPIVAEVRKAREEHAATFNYDLEAICRDLREIEKRNRRKVVSLTPRPPMQAMETGVGSVHRG